MCVFFCTEKIIASANRLNHILYKAFEKFCSATEIIRSPDTTKNTPWLTDEIRLLIK